ncbi:MAG: hypothetical protein RRY12_03465 [Cloacibacillus sp.]
MKNQNDRQGRMIYITRHFQDGGAELVPCRMERVGPEHLDEAVRLHDTVSHGLSYEIFAASPHEEIKRFLGPEGYAVGVFYENRLIALRTIKMSDLWTNEALDSFSVVRAANERPAVTGFCVVDSEFRGNNVQFLTQYLVENEAAREHTSLVTTVAPKNVFSLENVLNCNFRIMGLTKAYGGYLRFVLKKDFRAEQPRLMTHGHLQLSIRDIKNQTKAISDGFYGYKLIRKPRGFHLLYAAAAACDARGASFLRADNVC